MPVIPDSKYRATALSAALSLTSTGKEMVTVDFRLIDQPDVLVRWRGFFTEKARDRTIESLRACGWKGDDLSVVEFPTGNEVIVETETEEWNDKETGELKRHSRVAWVNAMRGPAVKNEMAAADAKAFAAKMRGAVLAFDAQNPEAKAKDAPGTIDGLPF
jgi:hypothetical protein